MSKVGQFLRESKAELKKVVWPSRDDVVSSVKVVIISTIIVAIVLGLLDFAFTEAFRALMK
ncbi:MAG: preprotein translocase subunit SecE [Treponema porcinum]|uniref:Protein translocase subunit SecE n=1 Tax=Treponema porcinum TaxID=261392 RepID=A0A1T4K2V2_TREPO|nr:MULTISPECIES: preprotein translocase subunit SecE [Treponema]MCI5644186.1 preprotein translocase subunit SecE [Treponema porcinum]MCI6179672.1 preprotein translocase subunit SecE [Treponema porcinum]MCI6323038.1 preprotein translocase subunit SecE [Treponema porcinum]MCI6481986.1 preprotein translocase subunit SecE [Treponema porcinum]MCI6721353.1 preprotein translocase subunit SecE [Treponema porcinum]